MDSDQKSGSGIWGAHVSVFPDRPEIRTSGIISAKTERSPPKKYIWVEMKIATLSIIGGVGAPISPLKTYPIGFSLSPKIEASEIK